MRPIEALEHPERTADLYLFDEQRPLGISCPLRRQPLDQVLAETLKIQVHAFDGALLHVEDVVDGDAVDPRREFAPEVELRQSGDPSNQDFLCGILRISRFHSMRRARPYHDLDPLNIEHAHGRPPDADELVSCPFDEPGAATVNPGRLA
jgi:hypothetical protein